MVTGNPFASMVPGFDFLQGLVKNAGSALPHMGQWVAPTLDPEELDKRIEELRTVQFWLEQNARMLAATIQALEVQRMTLSTLQHMNVSMGELQEAMTLKPSPVAPARASAPAPEPAPAPTPPAAAPAAPDEARAATGPAGRRSRAAAASEAPADASPGVVDPMQWWGALTQQFTQLASQAVRDTNASTGAWGQALAPQAGAGAATPASRKGSAKPAAAAKPATAKRRSQAASPATGRAKAGKAR